MDTLDLTTVPNRVRTSFGWLLNRNATIAHRMVTEGLGAVDADRYQYATLAALDQYGPSSQAALSRTCGIDRSDVVATINELAEQGFVERAVDASDRRRNTITITPAGVERLHRLDAVIAEIQDVVAAPFSAEERDELVRLLTKLLEHHTAK